MNTFAKFSATVALGATLVLWPCAQADITYGDRHEHRTRLNTGKDSASSGAEHEQPRHHRDHRDDRHSDGRHHSNRDQDSARRPGVSARTHQPREHRREHEQFRDGYQNGYRDALRERNNGQWHPNAPYIQPGYGQPYQLPPPGYGPPTGYGQHSFPYAQPEYRGFNFPQDGSHLQPSHRHRQPQQRLR